MKKGLIRKGLVFSIIVLFVGVGIQPVFAEESITSTLDNEDCIDCQVTNDYPIICTIIYEVILNCSIGF